MKLFSIYLVELRRLILSKFVWFTTALSFCSLLYGYVITSKGYEDSTMTNQYIAQPILTGAAIGAVLWAILALLESDRIYRAKTDTLIDTMISPVVMALSRVLVLMTLSLLVALLCMIFFLPYTMIKIDYLFNPLLYFSSYLMLIPPIWWCSILLASAFYHITHQIELAGLLYVGCVYFSYSRYVSRSYFARWINPIIIGYSDGFSNALILRITFYARVFWLLLAGGLWLLSTLCIRRYQKGLTGSFLRSLRKVYIPVISAMLLCMGVLLWVFQPYVNHAPYEWIDDDTCFENKTAASVSHITYNLTAKTSGIVNGIAEYTIDKSNNLKDNIWLDPGYRILSVTCDGKDIPFHTLKKDINEFRKTTLTIPKGAAMKLVIKYRGMPQMLRCFIPYSWDNTSSLDYVSLSNGATIPTYTSFEHPDKYDLKLTLPRKLVPIINHQLLTDYAQNSNGTRTWKKSDMTGYTVWLTACDYENVEFQGAGATINLIYSKKYDQNIKKYDIPQSISDVMDYCTAHLGPLSFINSGKLMMVQRSASFGGGGGAGEGWVEWTEDLFTQNNLSDKMKGANAAEVFAHEIIHEWWGGLGVYCGDNGLWSDEGLDVYTTYRLMKEKYGSLYAKQNYVDKWKTAVEEQNRGYYNRHPEMLTKLPEKYQAELKSHSQEINLYCRMPLMILKAEQLVGGEASMDKILRSIQEKYAQDPEKYTNPFSYQEFLSACGLKEEDLNLE